MFSRLKEGFSILFFVLRQRPRISLQCLALEHSLYKAKHCRDILGRCLRTKTRYKISPLDCESWVNKLEQFLLAVYCLGKITPAIEKIFLFNRLMIFKRQKSLFRWNCWYNSEYQFSSTICSVKLQGKIITFFPSYIIKMSRSTQITY